MEGLETLSALTWEISLGWTSLSLGVGERACAFLSERLRHFHSVIYLFYKYFSSAHCVWCRHCAKFDFQFLFDKAIWLLQAEMPERKSNTELWLQTQYILWLMFTTLEWAESLLSPSSDTSHFLTSFSFSLFFHKMEIITTRTSHCCCMD